MQARIKNTSYFTGNLIQYLKDAFWWKNAVEDLGNKDLFIVDRCKNERIL